MFALMAVILELLVFSRSYMLSDMSTLSVTRTARMVEESRNLDLLLMGASRSLVVNAAQLESELDHYDNAYNYSVPSLGTSLQYSMILEKYLDHNREPRVILLALGPEIFGQFKVDALFYSLWSGEAERFWRFFSLPELLQYMPFKEKIFIVPLYMQAILNSYNYRMNIRDYINYRLFGIDKWGVGDVVDRNRRLLDIMDETKGQMIYWPDRKVPNDEMIFENIIPLGGLAEYQYESYYLRKDENIRRFLHMTSERNIPVIVFFMPVPEPRYELMDSYGNFNYTRRRMDDFEERFKNVYFLDQDISYDMLYFGDSSHLNADGAAKFNVEFARDIKHLMEQGYGQVELVGRGLFFDLGATIEGRVKLAGFYEKEENVELQDSWRWSSGEVSSFVFPWIKNEEPRKYRVIFEVQPFLPQINQAMVLGTPIDNTVVVLQSGRQQYSVELMFPTTDELEVSVSYAAAMSPLDLDMSADERVLAVRWFNISLQYVAEN
jgi:hypothetical protein